MNDEKETATCILPNLKGADALTVANACVEVLNSKKAHDLKMLHVEEQTVLANYFVICTGTSNTQIRALANELEVKMTEAGEPPLRIDGYTEASWVILDFGCVMVHIFSRSTRDFYGLEKLWADSAHVDLSALIK